MLRLLGVVLAIAATMGVGAAALSGDASKESAPERPPAERSTDGGIEVAQLRLREGTRLNDQLGHFQLSGDALTFVDENSRELGGLPNLNLERVLRMLKTVDDPASVKWSVSGAVTEFAGRNYLLISRAVYKAATPPAPETVEAADLAAAKATAPVDTAPVEAAPAPPAVVEQP